MNDPELLIRAMEYAAMNAVAAEAARSAGRNSANGAMMREQVWDALADYARASAAAAPNGSGYLGAYGPAAAHAEQRRQLAKADRRAGRA